MKVIKKRPLPSGVTEGGIKKSVRPRALAERLAEYEHHVQRAAKLIRAWC
jgi:hypothetical protein